MLFDQNERGRKLLNSARPLESIFFENLEPAFINPVFRKCIRRKKLFVVQKRAILVPRSGDDALAKPPLWSPVRYKLRKPSHHVESSRELMQSTPAKKVYSPHKWVLRHLSLRHHVPVVVIDLKGDSFGSRVGAAEREMINRLILRRLSHRMPRDRLRIGPFVQTSHRHEVENCMKAAQAHQMPAKVGRIIVVEQAVRLN